MNAYRVYDTECPQCDGTVFYSVEPTDNGLPSPYFQRGELVQVLTGEDLAEHIRSLGWGPQPEPGDLCACQRTPVEWKAVEVQIAQRRAESWSDWS